MINLLEARIGKTVEITLSDDTDMEGTIKRVASDGKNAAIELDVHEELDDGEINEGIYIINWEDVRYIQDIE